MTCPWCSTSIVPQEECDNDCKTVTCLICQREYFMKDGNDPTKGHNPQCGSSAFPDTNDDW